VRIASDEDTVKNPEGLAPAARFAAIPVPIREMAFSAAQIHRFEA
jgi:hypothetical protein